MLGDLLGAQAVGPGEGQNRAFALGQRMRGEEGVL